MSVSIITRFFFFNDTATTEIYTLSLHDALPISPFWTLLYRLALTGRPGHGGIVVTMPDGRPGLLEAGYDGTLRSEEHTSELQSQSNLVCRLLLEKKKQRTNEHHYLITTRYDRHT